ncbi:hypothetical protein MTO96_013165 [Rhipicephalus appendiculatus]
MSVTDISSKAEATAAVSDVASVPAMAGPSTSRDALRSDQLRSRIPPPSKRLHAVCTGGEAIGGRREAE